MYYNLNFIGFTDDGEQLTADILEEYEGSDDVRPMEFDDNFKCDLIENYPDILTARSMFVYFEKANYFASSKQNQYYAIFDFCDSTQYVFEYKP